MITVKLNNAAYDEMSRRFEKLERKAIKLGLTPLTVKHLGTESAPILDSAGLDWGSRVKLNILEIEGGDVVISGWQFAAKLITKGEAGTQISRVPGFEDEIPVRFRETDTGCDHCRVNRQRINVYALRNVETGAWMQVGSSCLVDFLGYGNAEAVAAYLMEVQDFIGKLSDEDGAGDEDGEGSYGRGSGYGLALDFYMAHVAAVIRVEGFWSRRAAEIEGRQSTASDALNNIRLQRERPKDAITVTDADAERAEKVIAWAREFFGGKPVALRSDYEHNMAVALAEAWIGSDGFGLAASAFGAYSREMERQIKESKARAESNWVGELGAKLKGIKVTVTRAIELPDYGYGVSFINMMLDESGNILKWKTTQELEQGAEYILSGTIHKDKGHDEYHGIRQTTLTRCKVEKV